PKPRAHRAYRLLDVRDRVGGVRPASSALKVACAAGRRRGRRAPSVRLPGQGQWTGYTEHRPRKDEAGAMNDHPPANGSRGSDPYRTLRLVALIAAIAGVILLAALAFVLSYAGIHALARQAGMSAGMARLFPIIFDAMLVVSCVAVLLLRGAGWW